MGHDCRLPGGERSISCRPGQFPGRGHCMATLYEADTNPNAHRGRDLLDLAGKVTGISIDGIAGEATNQLGSITSKEDVDRAVRQLLDAPVDQQRRRGTLEARTPWYFI